MTQAMQGKRVEKVKQFQKWIVLITGTKGGTGKSTFSRGLRDVFLDLGVRCAAYDSDKDNAQLHRFYKDVEDGVNRIDIFTRGGADALIDDMESSSSTVMLVDLPAGSGRALESFEAEMGFVETSRELGYGVTLVSVLSRVKDSVNALRLLMESFDDRVNYVAVKNLFFGKDEQFGLLDGSKAKERLLELGGQVITMPELFDETFDLIDERNLTFRAAVAEGSGLTRSHRNRVYQWLGRFEQEVRQAGMVLGVER